MKKFLNLLLLFLIYINSFSWELIEQTDDFREKTGQYVISNKAKNNQGIFILTPENTILFATGEYIGIKQGKLTNYNVFIKVDNGKVKKIKGVVSERNLFAVGIIEPQPELIELMKKGKNLKIVVECWNGEKSFVEFDLKGFKNKFLEFQRKIKK